MTESDESLWTHRVRFDSARQGLTLDLVADEDRRKIIAEGFGMVSLDALIAHIVTRDTKGVKPLVHLHIALRGEVTQECGVSLEPFTHAISADLDLDLIESRDVTDEIAAVGENELGLDDLDEPDVVQNGQIDLGQYIIEALGEAYDPFARKPGVVFEEPEPEREPSPFAVLAKLKRDE
ncbi:YceD family protein [Asticcacaulis solisilvae]|uniref:YceD family protein n=1 Tax=Asticcacaulis solisilvae TaxID=1217274 RepID=UPI003FD89027